MAQLRISSPDDAAATTGRKAPSVLVVIVVKDGAAWLRECLTSLSKQSHPRLGVVAVDNGSTDGSVQLLVRTLGSERVIELGANRGFAAGLQAALGTDVASRADYVLFLHDDVALDTEAVARMVDAAERIQGTGIVGPKVVDWDDPRVLRDVGLSTDRFGYPYSPLEEDEIDHGQYDRVREVLFVSSCAMLVSRATWARVGLPDERFAARFEDLDLCWRARLAGFRVLMTPLALARHRSAALHRERAGALHERRGADRSRYYAERAALASMLKNYGIPSLLWVLPLYAVQGVGKIALMALSRRLVDVGQVLAAWWWNVVNLPGTIRRRVRAQAVRAVPDRAVRRYMAPATIRLRRWVDIANRILLGRGGHVEDLEEGRTAADLPTRAFSIVRNHPVAVTWSLGVLVALLSFRHLVGPELLSGGALPSFPGSASDFLRELVSGVRTPGLGGAHPGSPGLAALAGVTALSFGSTALAQKLLVVALPAVAGVAMFRAVARRTGQRGAAAVAGAAYLLSAIGLWAISEGRIAELVLLAVLPYLGDRLTVAFSPSPPGRSWRFVVGTGAMLAVGTVFLPGAALAFAVLLGAHLAVGVSGGRRVRGATLAGASAAVAAALAFPVVLELLSADWAALGSRAGTADVSMLGRLAPGPSPGSWAVAWFLPAAAVLGFALVEAEARRPALRHLLAASAGVSLAWASGAGFLPAALSNVPVYLAVATASACALLGLGLAWVVPRLSAYSFGLRQVAVGVLVGLTAGGIALGAARAALGDWDVGPERQPPAWPVVSEADPGLDYRVLWLGSAGGEELPAPAGDPLGTVRMGDLSLRYTIGGRVGRSALDLARTESNEPRAALERAVATALSGETRHAGAMLAPFAVRYVVADETDVPRTALERLRDQIDLDHVPAGGLVIFRNAVVLPRAGVVTAPGFDGAARSQDALALARITDAEGHLDADPLDRRPGGFGGPLSPGAVERYVLLSDEYAPGWRLDGASSPERAFGWAIGFPDAEGTGIDIRYGDQAGRTIQVWVLAALWIAALAFTSKPARRVSPRAAGRHVTAVEAEERSPV